MTVTPDMVGDQGAGESQNQSVDQGNDTASQNDWLADTSSDSSGDQDNSQAGDDTGENEGQGNQADDTGKGDDTQETMYELPDGRKVNAETLAKEWKENFLPDYTRKSQKVAEYEKGNNSNINNEQGKDTGTKKPWEDPNWVPETPGQIVQVAMEALKEEAKAKAEAETQARDAINKEVESQLDQCRQILAKTDPKAKLDETALFQHAQKFEFTNLVKAFENMQEIKNTAVQTEQRVLKNIKTRSEDGVGGGGGDTGDSGLDYNEISQNQGGVFGAVSSYLERIGKK